MTTPTTPTTETIHGFPIIKAHRLSEQKGNLPARVILVDRGASYDPHDRYVTGLLCDGREEWIWGHYASSLTKASQDFDARVARGY